MNTTITKRPMNTDLITLREFKNNGRHIHLYHNDDANVWMAYGYSAYALFIQVKDSRRDSVQSFSYSLMMPCITVSESVIRNLRNAGRIIEETTDTYLYLELQTDINTDDYLTWASDVRETSTTGK